jgi:hypothetical protein
MRSDRTCIKETSIVYKMLVSNPKKKISLGRPGHRWVNVQVADKDWWM